MSVARSTAWISVSGEAGRLDGYVLTVESAGVDRARWAVEAGAKLPDGFAPRLLTAHAYEALRDGTVEQGGALVWKGRRRALRDAWDGTRMIARLEPLPT
ncbi:hypothetical protein [Sorangium sp. So ce887]|uniref:hypothetical protein n=1 Tax=Sorangium sp. So ce887 TaxID=3133324 RepID=UPI003F646779